MTCHFIRRKVDSELDFFMFEHSQIRPLNGPKLCRKMKYMCRILIPPPQCTNQRPTPKTVKNFAVGGEPGTPETGQTPIGATPPI
ncbi:hypothetical protein Syun_026295 [Stephania yunnanensis]|uniref:Uncharacterized protein n=1 Tax=Stephania yunnanensis TaxID=152371 RepID=A0AAP0ETB2_9MAGN